jgi:hypothetical protein
MYIKSVEIIWHEQYGVPVKFLMEDITTIKSVSSISFKAL